MDLACLDTLGPRLAERHFGFVEPHGNCEERVVGQHPATLHPRNTQRVRQFGRIAPLAEQFGQAIGGIVAGSRRWRPILRRFPEARSRARHRPAPGTVAASVSAARADASAAVVSVMPRRTRRIRSRSRTVARRTLHRAARRFARCSSSFATACRSWCVRWPRSSGWHGKRPPAPHSAARIAFAARVPLPSLSGGAYTGDQPVLTYAKPVSCPRGLPMTAPNATRLECSPEQLRSIADLYEQGLYLQAYRRGGDRSATAMVGHAGAVAGSAAGG